MTDNLESLSLGELRDLRNKVDRAIASYEQRRVKEALAAVETAAREHGFNLADLTAIKGAKPKVAAKYANPDDPSQTWSGRGRKPHWVLAHIESGKSLDDLAI